MRTGTYTESNDNDTVLLWNELLLIKTMSSRTFENKTKNTKNLLIFVYVRHIRQYGTHDMSS